MSVSAWVRLLTGCRCAGNGRVGKNCRTDGGLLSEVQDARKAGMSAIAKGGGYTGGRGAEMPSRMSPRILFLTIFWPATSRHGQERREPAGEGKAPSQKTNWVSLPSG